MATHTNNGGSNNRKFAIGRENGEKTARPVFLEWLRELPAEDDRKGRIIETRQGSNGPRYYERFSALDGMIIDIWKESRAIMEEERTFLYIKLDDGNEVYEVEIGDFDGRYSLNLMARLCSPDFDPMKKSRVSPYATEKDGKMYIGVSLYNGPDKIESRREGDGFQPTKPETSEFKGKTLWNFLPVAQWFYDYLQTNVVPNLPENAWQVVPAPSGPAPQPATTARTSNASQVPFPVDDVTSHAEGIPDGSDLPF